MGTTCKNCNANVLGNFCSQCGQPTNTHRISAHFLWHDIQHGLLHVDKGILFTAKELFTRPGHSIREFLQGKRAKHFRPVSLVIVLAGVYGFLSHYFHINLLSNNIQVTGTGAQANEIKKLVEGSSSWLSQHYAVFALLQIPIFAIASWLCFKKSGYNFMEHIIINTFLTGQRLMLRIAAFPLYYFFNNTPALRNVARATDIISYLLITWAFFQLFNKLPVWQRIARTLGTFAIAFLIIFIIMFFIFSSMLGL